MPPYISFIVLHLLRNYLEWNFHGQPWNLPPIRCQQNSFHSWNALSTHSIWLCMVLGCLCHRILSVQCLRSVQRVQHNLIRTLPAYPYRTLECRENNRETRNVLHAVTTLNNRMQFGRNGSFAIECRILPWKCRATYRFIGTVMVHVQSERFRSVFG